MKKHKWKDISPIANIKRFECVKCGINREWCFGDYQCWEYTWFVPHTNENRTQGHTFHKSYKRPDCISKPVENVEILTTEQYNHHANQNRDNSIIGFKTPTP